MTNLSQNSKLGIAFLALGLGLIVALNPWYIGMVFMVIGAHRLFVGLTANESAKE